MRLLALFISVVTAKAREQQQGKREDPLSLPSLL